VIAYAPELATLVKEPPDGPAWLHELKYDGYRIGCAVERAGRGRRARVRVRLTSRRGNDWTDRFPEIARAAERLAAREALLDGEVVVLRPDGRTSFQALQQSFSWTDGAVGRTYFAFDLLVLDGNDLRPRPLAERKEALRELLARSDVGSALRYADHVDGPGRAVLAEACRLGAEGIVSKRRDAPYRAVRGGDWLKTKCLARQEVVIGGWLEPAAASMGVGALLVGVHDDDDDDDGGGRLRFAGKVGTGWTHARGRELRRALEAIATDRCPFSPPPGGRLGREARWVEPRLVAEVAFTEWTAGGHIRHPSFQGLREDKPAREVGRERPRRAGPEIVISHAERVVFPGEGITKGDVARYYEEVAEAMLPHVVGRPLTLGRCTGDIGTFAFARHDDNWWERSGIVPRATIADRKNGVGQYLYIEKTADLIALAQMNVVEIHTWNTRVGDVERADRVVLDVDPGPEVGWAEVVAAARTLRRALAAAGLESWVKTTGGVGLHVVAPIAPAVEWEVCLAFAREVARALEAHDPRRYTTALARAGRERKILVDSLRNNRSNTSVAALSLRARPGATISTPIAWDELGRARPERFTLATVPRRLARLGADPWAGYFAARQGLPAGIVSSEKRIGG
jgi:bifunctional non-homologous end joining protein LigD